MSAKLQHNSTLQAESKWGGGKLQLPGGIDFYRDEGDEGINSSRTGPKRVEVLWFVSSHNIDGTRMSTHSRTLY